MPTAPVPIAEQKTMRLKKTVAVALATAMLASVAAVPAFAANTTNKITVKANDTGYAQYLDDAETADNTANSFNTESDTSKGTTEVKYIVTEAYTWSIPKEIDFGTNVGVGQTVTVTKNADNQQESKTNVKNEGSVVAVTTNVIPNNKKLEITATATHGTNNTQELKVESSEGATLGYEVTVGTATFKNGDVVLSVNAGTNTASADLKFKLTTQVQNANSNAAEIAGTYKGTITYTAEVKDQGNT